MAGLLLHTAVSLDVQALSRDVTTCTAQPGWLEAAHGGRASQQGLRRLQHEHSCIGKGQRQDL